MAISDHEHLPETVAFCFDSFCQRLSQRLAGCGNHRLDTLADVRACFWFEPHEDAMQLSDGRAAIAIAGADLPLRGFTGRHFVAFEIGLDVIEEVVDRFNAATRAARLEHVALLPLRHLLCWSIRFGWRQFLCDGLS